MKCSFEISWGSSFLILESFYQKYGFCRLFFPTYIATKVLNSFRNYFIKNYILYECETILTSHIERLCIP